VGGVSTACLGNSAERVIRRAGFAANSLTLKKSIPIMLSWMSPPAILSRVSSRRTDVRHHGDSGAIMPRATGVSLNL